MFCCHKWQQLDFGTNEKIKYPYGIDTIRHPPLHICLKCGKQKRFSVDYPG